MALGMHYVRHVKLWSEWVSVMCCRFWATIRSKLTFPDKLATIARLRRSRPWLAWMRTEVSDDSRLVKDCKELEHYNEKRNHYNLCISMRKCMQRNSLSLRVIEWRFQKCDYGRPLTIRLQNLYTEIERNALRMAKEDGSWSQTSNRFRLKTVQHATY